MFCKTNGDKKSQELHLSTCIQLRVLKRLSRKVINFRHLLSCDTIVGTVQVVVTTGPQTRRANRAKKNDYVNVM